MISFRVTAIGVLSVLAFGAAAQAPDELAPLLRSIISGPSDVAVGRTIVLNASASVARGDDVQYRWYREGAPQPISRTVEAVYTPEEPGTTVFRLVLSATVEGERIEAETTHTVTVYTRKITLIADSSVPLAKIQVHQEMAAQQGVFVRVLRSTEGGLPLSEESSLQTLIAEQLDALDGADTVVLWSEGITGLRALLGAVQSAPSGSVTIPDKTLVLLTDHSLNTIARTAGGPFSVLEPDRIVVTRTEGLNQMVATEDITAFLSRLESADIDYVIVDESTVGVRPWNLLTSLVNYMLTHGVPSRTIIFLLMLPIIATILAFLKQVIGMTTFGLYTPSILALSFLALGWVGLPFLLIILVTGYLTRSGMRRWRLLYIPKVAIILTMVSFTLLFLLGGGAFFGLTLSGSDTIFILLIMSTLSETLLNVRAEQGLWSAILGVSETIVAALLCVLIVRWGALQSVVLAYPELILLTLPINVFLGRWTGLRLVEYFRFQEIFRHIEE